MTSADLRALAMAATLGDNLTPERNEALARACTGHRILAMLDVIDAAKAMHVTVGSETDNGKVAFDAAIAKLEQK
jgi:siroheme synthase (precorrin-2 oxidase/ferrochelatase)